MTYFSKKVSTLGLTSLLGWLFLAFVFLIPIQTRLVLFFPESYIDQSFIFYNALFLYASDIALVVVLVIWLVGLLFHGKQKISPSVPRLASDESERAF